jgi:hypothetical protein
LRVLIEKFIENGKLVGSSPIKGISKIQLGPSSLEKIGTETTGPERQGLGRGLGSVTPDKKIGIGERRVEAEHGTEDKTTFRRSIL